MFKLEMRDVDGGVRGPEEEEQKESEEEKKQRGEERDEAERAGSETKVATAAATEAEAENWVGGDEEVRIGILEGGGVIGGEKWLCV